MEGMSRKGNPPDPSRKSLGLFRPGEVAPRIELEEPHVSPTLMIGGVECRIEYAARGCRPCATQGAKVTRELNGSGEFRIVPA